MERFKTAKRYINRFGEHKPIMADIVIKYYGTKLLVVSLPDSQSYIWSDHNMVGRIKLWMQSHSKMCALTINEEGTNFL